MIQIHDNWHPRPHNLREHALAQSYAPIDHAGLQFPGFSLIDTLPGMDSLLSATLCREVVELQQSFRLYTPDMQQPTFIHKDNALSSHAAILYLDQNYVGGTGFWEPLRDLANPHDSNDWRCTLNVPGEFNRLLVFNSQLWHSRSPRHLSPGQSRLIWVAFFNLSQPKHF